MLVEENGESYRVDTNAVGDKFWIQDGRVHRTNGPAIEYHNGIKVWCIRGQVHRTDGPAYEYPDGKKIWMQSGMLHRENGPAYEYPSGTSFWYLNDKLHRLDGPAALVSDHTSGDEYRIVPTEEEWWIDGRRYNKEQYDIKIGELQNAN